MKKFEKSFLLGAATAAHQVEGNNVYSDFWAQEHMKNTTFVEPSLEAVDHYNRYEEDIKHMAEAGLNAYRLSIEWARIEPEEGSFSSDEIEHYRQVIKCCRDNDIEPIVTLHHFSSPKWLISKGGWEAATTPDYFARYAKYTVERLGADLKYICTINEANMGVQIAAIAKKYMLQMMAQQAKENKQNNGDGEVQVGINLEKMMAAHRGTGTENLEVFGIEKLETFTSPRTEAGDKLIIDAHMAARKVIKETCPHIKVGLTLSLHDVQSLPGGEEKATSEWADEFTHYLPALEGDDFLGVQNYSRSLIGPDGVQPAPEDAELTQMNYEFYPQALENVIRKVAREFQGELMVTENGIATSDDSRRVEFIRQALAGVQNCIADGINVSGYMHWSLLDNFEWQKGYSMTFGLIEVDRKTQTRMPKESLNYLGSHLSR